MGLKDWVNAQQLVTNFKSNIFHCCCVKKIEQSFHWCTFRLPCNTTSLTLNSEKALLLSLSVIEDSRILRNLIGFSSKQNFLYITSLWISMKCELCRIFGFIFKGKWCVYDFACSCKFRNIFFFANRPSVVLVFPICLDF